MKFTEGPLIELGDEIAYINPMLKNPLFEQHPDVVVDDCITKEALKKAGLIVSTRNAVTTTVAELRKAGAQFLVTPTHTKSMVNTYDILKMECNTKVIIGRDSVIVDEGNMISSSKGDRYWTLDLKN